jgi:membrane-bound lytic murein transglycosylase MltF
MKSTKKTPAARWASCRVFFVAVITAVSAATLSGAGPGVASDGQASRSQNPLDRINDEFTGDLPEITERRLLRVLISYSRTNYFVDFATERGFEYELLRKYEEHLNKGRKLSQRIVVTFVPVPLEDLLSELGKGRGDIAAGGLTIAPERQRQVAFTKPYIPNVREVVVASKNAPVITGFDDLAGREIWVRGGSSYAEHLGDINILLRSGGKKPVDIRIAPGNLATEDLLELVNAGVFGLTIADEHIAKAWAGVLPKIRVHDEVAVDSGGSIAWAVRPGNSELLASLNSFLGTVKKGTLLGNVFFNRYFTDSKWISNPLSAADADHLYELIDLFQKYGDMYGFEWEALAAVGYQESRLIQSTRSRAGAIGIMQLRPSTAADKNAGVTPIDTVENNIHAGAKYLAFLRDRYFSDPDIPEGARFDFTLAACNAGPARVASLRKEASQKGFDPNLWFSNVETIAASRVGAETVTYVANINKYFLAYSGFVSERIQRDLQMQSLESATKK